MASTLGLLGLALQATGIIIGGYGLIGEIILNSAFLKAIDKLLYDIQKQFSEMQMEGLVQIPRCLLSSNGEWSIKYADTYVISPFFTNDEPPVGFNNMYNRGEYYLSWIGLLILVVALNFGFIVFLCSIIYFALPLHIVILIAIFWFIALFCTNSLAAYSRIKILKRLNKVQKPINCKKFTLLFIVGFFRYWFLGTFRFIILILLLFLHILTHWIAWITHLLPNRYYIDLAKVRNRERYYAIYALVVLLLGIILRLTSFSLQ